MSDVPASAAGLEVVYNVQGRAVGYKQESASAATLQTPHPRVRCPVCGGEAGVRSTGRLRSHVRKVCDVGIDGEPEYRLCAGSGGRP